ncbi:PrsW family intramembrane metalloprotease [Corynebacterium sp.]|uniref:PrsW family intramembrane metalloprotease n=1 Tax=Corynebacterium sp. TaxID=1720 RepID=UPI00198A653A|nr:PrsW family intramembrane metalloprotease [Corynebacterium sp.]HHU67961.1 PrsW family intramembrane metalloprotease [Corynebacterium sp.]
MSPKFRYTLGALNIVGVPTLLFFTFINFYSSPLGGLVGVGLAAVLLAVVLWLLSRSPMWPERSGAGWRWVVAGLLWGAGVSFTFVMVGGVPIITITNRLDMTLFAASFGGAYPEEIAKFLGVGVILFSFRALNRPWHGLMTGAVIGLGFELAENIMYGASGAVEDPNSDLTGVLGMWGLRLVLGPGLHVIFSALAGWGLGLALFTAGRSRAWRAGVAGGWLFVAFSLHFLWNTMWPQEWMLLTNYLVLSLIMYPLFIWVWVRAHRAARADASYAWTERPLTSLPSP